LTILIIDVTFLVCSPSGGYKAECTFNVTSDIEIVPDSDPIWQKPWWDQLYGNTSGTLDSRVQNVLSHERDHQSTIRSFYDIVSAMLIAGENITHGSAQDCQQEIRNLKLAVQSLWQSAGNHSKEFDLPGWNTGGQYSNHPFPE
jgi:hypothetical protein